jgi:hypothetical protein
MITRKPCSDPGFRRNRRPGKADAQKDWSNRADPFQDLHMQWVEMYKAFQPFLLLFATALISNYLIPEITRRWQDHQKELELKTGLVTEISESVLDIVLAAQFEEAGAATQTQEQYDQAYRTWEKRKAIIGSKLRAYYPKTDLGQVWDEFAEVVSEVSALSGPTDAFPREERLARLKDYFRDAPINWDTLAKPELKKEGISQFQTFYRTWFSLRQQILRRKDALIQRILDTKIIFFS